MNRALQQTELYHYTTLGRSGLRVSPFSFGTGTFGQQWGESWSNDYGASKAVLAAYVDAGGNFLDTADIYHNGESEEITGKLVKELGGRDRFVIATKYTMAMDPNNPNKSGNGRLHMMAAVDASLRRLGTDYIDLFYTHWWDGLTPVEEVMQGMDTLVRSGKIRYVGMSNPPAWYFSKANMLALQHGRSPVIALQMQYNLLVRDIEEEYIDAAKEYGTALLPWSPLANGLLSGKYTIDAEGKLMGKGRYVDSWVTDPSVDLKSPRTRNVLEVLRAVASEVGASPAQVALNWVQNRAGVGATIIGASRPEQVKDNVAALKISLTEEQRQRLDDASAPPARYPYYLTTVHNKASIIGKNPIKKWE